MARLKILMQLVSLKYHFILQKILIVNLFKHCRPSFFLINLVVLKKQIFLKVFIFKCKNKNQLNISRHWTISKNLATEALSLKTKSLSS